MSRAIVGHRASTPALVAIGASAGGVEPLLTVLSELPADLPATILVVVHVPRSGPSALPRIVSRVAALPAGHAVDGQALEPGRILIAPPDHHLIVDGAVALVRRGPMINRSRPAIDPLFQSVALHAGPRAIGIVLSGALDDGAAGLATIGEAGGTTIVQEPTEAMYPSMPEAALQRAVVQHRLPVAQIAHTVIGRLSMPEGRTNGVPDEAKRLEKELMMSQLDDAFVTSDELGANVSVYGCPACGGSLWELGEGAGFRFRCRVGHAFSPQTLLETQGSNAEDGLWIAVRALDEQAALARRLADEAVESGQDLAHRRFSQQAETAERHAASIRRLLQDEPGVTNGAASEAAAASSTRREATAT